VARLRIRVSPAVVTIGRSPSIEIVGVPAGYRVVVTATTTASNGLYRASATLVAGPSGVVSLNHVSPLGGVYRGPAALGLLGVQRLVASAPHPARFAVIDTTFQAKVGRLRASARLVQRVVGPGVIEKTESLGRDRFLGRFFTPAHGRDRPAVIVWGGSEGGISDSALEAAALASAGIPALAVAYFDESGLPCSLSHIPIDYFATAVRWLARQPGIDPSRIWALSGSRGSEAEFLLAAHWPGLLHGLVAEAPSSIGYGPVRGQCMPRSPVAWTVHGKPVPHAPAGGVPRLTANGLVDERPVFLRTVGLSSTQAARIPIGHYRGPVMLFAGGSDELWPSSTYAHQLIAELHADPSVHRLIIYPSAGHIVFGVPSIPAPVTETGARFTLNLGGTLAANDAAHRADWPLALRFIKTH
jgi:dienelactone hydrolase